MKICIGHQKCPKGVRHSDDAAPDTFRVLALEAALFSFPDDQTLTSQWWSSFKNKIKTHKHMGIIQTTLMLSYRRIQKRRPMQPFIV